MERMRHQVKENNVYRWASNVLTELCAVRLEGEPLDPSPDSTDHAKRKLVYQ